jgi:phenolic acid decarboxylase
LTWDRVVARQHGERTVCFQNDYLDQMHIYRDEGPTHPIYVVPEFAYITLVEHVGTDDESVIDVALGELPPRWADRSN